MHIAIVTAGGAGMFCGSCMHDNAWARALIASGHQVSLVPTYTPLRLDEPTAITTGRVFLGGVNVYLDAQSRFWRAIPRSLKKWLDNPRLLNLVSRLSTQNDYSQLGDLTLAMLDGENGPERPAIEELADFLTQLKPDVIILSNVLLSGVSMLLRERVQCPLLAVLQGDDVFLDALPETFRVQSIQKIRERSSDFVRLFAHTRFYRGYMARYLGLEESKIDVLPLSIDGSEHTGRPQSNTGRPPTVGYFARLAPEKGLHHLVDAMQIVRQQLPDVRLRVGGYLGRQHDDYFARIQTQTSGWGAGFEYIGSPATLAEKIAFFESCDVTSVPTEFLEPKGLYVLESLANGVPVVQPAHGSFPELIESTGGGWLAEPKSPQSLAAAIVTALSDPHGRRHTAEAGYDGVRRHHSPPALAQATLRTLETVTNAR